eukprot:COSAG01_NODE_3399_length_6142_cov_11.969236_5_plen_70_part_00
MQNRDGSNEFSPLELAMRTPLLRGPSIVRVLLDSGALVSSFHALNSKCAHCGFQHLGGSEREQCIGHSS